jgi:inhibitor of cysteine peptidase
VSIAPVVDFNGDAFVDKADVCIMVDHWGTDNRLCDIGPMPWGDGVVDVQDLVVVAEHLFEAFPPVEPIEVNENDDGGQVELKLGQMLVVTLESNPTTGYRWQQADNPESVLQHIGEAEFKPSQTGEPPLIGAGGLEIFRFRAVRTGQMTLQLVYHRPWEEGAEPLKTFSLEVVVP